LGSPGTFVTVYDAEPTRGDDIRRELARELHDRVAQTLTTMLIELENYKTEHDGNHAVLRQLDGLQESTRDVLNNLRHILYDLRGHGLSERPPAGYTVGEAVTDLVGVLDALGVDRPVHLVGNSYGGVVALRAALEVPERVRSLVLIEAHCADDDEAQGSDWAELMADTLTATALSLEHDRLPDQLLAVGDRKLARMARTAEALLSSTTLVEDLAATETFSELELAGVHCPVLAVYGEHSDLAPSARALGRHVPACRLEIIPGLAHTVLREATGTVLALVLGWLAGDLGVGTAPSAPDGAAG